MRNNVHIDISNLNGNIADKHNTGPNQRQYGCKASEFSKIVSRNCVNVIDASAAMRPLPGRAARCDSRFHLACELDEHS